MNISVSTSRLHSRVLLSSFRQRISSFLYILSFLYFDDYALPTLYGWACFTYFSTVFTNISSRFAYLSITGRSNAINIAERLGLPHTVIDGARNLHGIASAEINGVNMSELFLTTFVEIQHRRLEPYISVLHGFNSFGNSCTMLLCFFV